jgi:hypothetical protein
MSAPETTPPTSGALPPLPPLPAGHTLAAALVWTRFHLGRNLKRRTFWFWLVGILLLQALLATAANMRGHDRAELFVVHLAPFVTLFFTSGVVREELEDQTITYGHCRPVDRAWLYGARVVAAMVPVFLVNLPGAIGAGMAVSDVAPLRYLLATILAAASHGAIFALLGQLLKWPTWVGLAWLIMWEAPVSKLPGFFGNFTLAAQVRAVAGLPPSQLLKTPWLPHEAPTALEATGVLLLVTLVGFGLGGWLMRRRESDVGK